MISLNSFELSWLFEVKKANYYIKLKANFNPMSIETYYLASVILRGRIFSLGTLTSTFLFNLS